MEHPEVIREAADKLQQKERAAVAKAATETLAKHRKELEQDPRDFVANPNGKYTVVDLQSKNGTFVNGAAISSWQLRDGDQITIGNTTLVYREKK